MKQTVHKEKLLHATQCALKRETHENGENYSDRAPSRVNEIEQKKYENKNDENELGRANRTKVEKRTFVQTRSEEIVNYKQHSFARFPFHF